MGIVLKDKKNNLAFMGVPFRINNILPMTLRIHNDETIPETLHMRCYEKKGELTTIIFFLYYQKHAPFLYS